MKRLALPLAVLFLLAACSGPAGEADEKSLESDAANIEGKADNAVNSAITEIEANAATDEGEGDEPVQKP
jgi:hypothetical protein